MPIYNVSQLGARSSNMANERTSVTCFCGRRRCLLAIERNVRHGPVSQVASAILVTKSTCAWNAPRLGNTDCNRAIRSGCSRPVISSTVITVIYLQSIHDDTWSIWLFWCINDNNNNNNNAALLITWCPVKRYPLFSCTFQRKVDNFSKVSNNIDHFFISLNYYRLSWAP